MGNCFFFQPSEDVKIPRLMSTINQEVSKKSLVNPFEPIDVIIDEKIPNNLITNIRKNETEFSLESPDRSTLSKHSTHVYFMKILLRF